MSTLFRKWWVILLQGILLIIIGFFFFNNPVEVLAVISFWVGLLTLVMGIVGIVGHFTVPKDERENNSLLWSIATLLLGFLMVSKVGLTMKVITVLFGFWVLFTGIWLISAGMKHREKGLPGWFLILVGALSVIAGIAIIFNLGTGAIYISTLLGLQALFAGIGLIVLAFTKKRLVNKLINTKRN